MPLLLMLITMMIRKIITDVDDEDKDDCNN